MPTYTTQQADRALVLLRPIVRDAREAYLTLREELSEPGGLAALEKLVGTGHAPAHVRAAYEALKGALAELGELEASLLDAELGLVSLPGAIGGRAVHLCWKLGEEAVRYWYPLGGRYEERRPLPGLGIPVS